MEERRRRSSGWTIVAAGCGSCFFLAAVVLGLLAWSGFRFANSFDDSHATQAEREQAVLSLLHAESLPEGYHAIGSLAVPMVLRLAVISDRRPDENGDLEIGERALFYARASPMLVLDRKEEQTLMDIAGIEISEESPLTEGILRIEGGELRYRRLLAGLTFQGSTRRGVVTTMAIRCHRESAFQAAIWLVSDTGASEAVDDTAISEAAPEIPGGIPEQDAEEVGDGEGRESSAEAVLTEFLTPFQFCPPL